MKFTLDSNGGLSIRAYGPGHVTVALSQGSQPEGGPPLQGLETIRTSLILTPNRMQRDWPPESFEDLRGEHFEPVLALEPEVVLFGSGERLRFPRAGTTACLTSRGIGVEVMDTAAACRTFNILVAEGRHVVAALLMI